MFDFDIGYPFIVFALICIGFLYWFTREREFKPEPQPQKITGDFTYEQLKQYDGIKKPQIFLALKGVIYDVSNSNFYKKDGAYGLFAGHDASINLSKMSHDESLLNKWPNYTLDEEQTKTLNDWVARFQAKYHKVGKVIQ